MNDAKKEQMVSYIEKASTIILGLLFVFLPLVFTNITTDVFVLPKQILLIFSGIVLLLLYGARTFFAQNLRIKRTPFDFPILIFATAVIFSVVFSIAKFDSLYNLVPLLFAVVSYFAITYNVRDQKSLTVLIGSLLLGGGLVSLISLFSFFKVYVFSFDFSKFQTFSTLGSSLDQAIYLALLLPLGVYFIYPYIKKGGRSIFSQTQEDTTRLMGFGILSIAILVGLAVSIYSLISLQKPTILPLETGFQTAFAAISQDGGRVIQGFLFGSGYGEFSNVFLKFKQAAFNTNASIWNLTFFRSSNFILELLATTGLLGLLSYLFICFRVLKQKPLFIPLVVLIVASFIVPFAFYHVVLLFFILGLYSSLKGLSNHQDFFDVELQLVASKKGFFVLSSEEVSGKQAEKYGKILSSIVLVVIVVFSGIFGFLTYDFALGNVTFQKSLLAASKNNGSLTYTYQSGVLNSVTGKYIDAYYRVFSQTNLALANSLANSVPKGSSPSAQTSQTISTLVQQSISSARSATTISSHASANWQNLSSVYRALIGFGQNADSFAILAAQQSIQLDPTNPQEYINLGGIYFQLKAWDKALEQFQLAINVKPDFTNAYYNHAHALIEKGDLSSALTELGTVKQLVAGDKTNKSKIDAEIKDLQARIAGNNQAKTTPTDSSLEVNKSESQLPTQNPPLKIPAPQTSVTTPTPTTNVSPTPKATPNP